MGVVSVLAAYQAPGGVVTVNNHLRGGITFWTTEAHQAQGVVLIVLCWR